ncbi:MAG: antitoxin VapB family protein, partial [Acidobacteriota bacterium]
AAADMPASTALRSVGLLDEAQDGRPGVRSPDRFVSILDREDSSMHDRCMATKTISLELDAYEKLKAARLHPRESFSSVVRRGRWNKQRFTAADLLEFMERRKAESSLLDADALRLLEEAQQDPRRSSPWDEGRNA